MDNKNPNNPTPKPNKPNMPKFNLNWMFSIIAIMLLFLFFTGDKGLNTKEISYDEFQQYVESGYISKVIGYDDNSVEAYIKPQHVKDIFQQDSNRVGKTPMVITEAPSRESLGDFLQKEKDEARFDGSISYEKKQNYIGLILWQVLPLAFIIGFFFFMSRRWASGSGMGGGGIFNVGKSKAQLFEKGSSVKVTFKDVAGLAGAKQEVEEIVEDVVEEVIRPTEPEIISVEKELNIPSRPEIVVSDVYMPAVPSAPEVVVKEYEYSTPSPASISITKHELVGEAVPSTPTLEATRNIEGVPSKPDFSSVTYESNLIPPKVSVFEVEKKTLTE